MQTLISAFVQAYVLKPLSHDNALTAEGYLAHVPYLCYGQ